MLSILVFHTVYVQSERGLQKNTLFVAEYKTLYSQTFSGTTYSNFLNLQVEKLFDLLIKVVTCYHIIKVVGRVKFDFRMSFFYLSVSAEAKSSSIRQFRKIFLWDWFITVIFLSFARLTDDSQGKSWRNTLHIRNDTGTFSITVENRVRKRCVNSKTSNDFLLLTQGISDRGFNDTVSLPHR